MFDLVIVLIFSFALAMLFVVVGVKALQLGYKEYRTPKEKRTLPHLWLMGFIFGPHAIVFGLFWAYMMGRITKVVFLHP